MANEKEVMIIFWVVLLWDVFLFGFGGCEVPLFAEIAATELSKCFLSPDVH